MQIGRAEIVRHIVIAAPAGRVVRRQRVLQVDMQPLAGEDLHRRPRYLAVEGAQPHLGAVDHHASPGAHLPGLRPGSFPTTLEP